MANTEEGPRYEAYLAKEPNDLHKRFFAWLVEHTGVSEEELDLKSVQLACALRMEFQRSDENQAHLKERRAAALKREEDREANAEERRQKRENAAKEKAAKAALAKAKKEAAAQAAPEADEEAEEAPVRTSRRRRGTAPAPAAEEAPKPTSRRRRGKPAPAAPVVEEDDDDFDEDDEL